MEAVSQYCGGCISACVCARGLHVCQKNSLISSCLWMRSLQRSLYLDCVVLYSVITSTNLRDSVECCGMEVEMWRFQRCRNITAHRDMNVLADSRRLKIMYRGPSVIVRKSGLAFAAVWEITALVLFLDSRWCWGGCLTELLSGRAEVTGSVPVSEHPEGQICCYFAEYCLLI